MLHGCLGWPLHLRLRLDGSGLNLRCWPDLILRDWPGLSFGCWPNLLLGLNWPLLLRHGPYLRLRGADLRWGWVCRPGLRFAELRLGGVH